MLRKVHLLWEKFSPSFSPGYVGKPEWLAVHLWVEEWVCVGAGCGGRRPNRVSVTRQSENPVDKSGRIRKQPQNNDENTKFLELQKLYLLFLVCENLWEFFSWYSIYVVGAICQNYVEISEKFNIAQGVRKCEKMLKNTFWEIKWFYAPRSCLGKF